MHNADYAVASVCPSVCLSVTRRYSVDTAEHIRKLFLPSGSTTILVSPYPTGWRRPLTEASNARGMKKITMFDQYLALSRKLYNIEAHNHGNEFCKYADVTYLIILANNVNIRMAEINNINTWACANNLTLNLTKTVEIIFVDSKRKRQVQPPSPFSKYNISRILSQSTMRNNKQPDVRRRTRFHSGINS